jgi:hypothetical protein
MIALLDSLSITRFLGSGRGKEFTWIGVKAKRLVQRRTLRTQVSGSLHDIKIILNVSMVSQSSGESWVQIAKLWILTVGELNLASR